MAEDRLRECVVEPPAFGEQRVGTVAEHETRLLDVDLVLADFASYAVGHQPLVGLQAGVAATIEVGQQQAPRPAASRSRYRDRCCCRRPNTVSSPNVMAATRS